MYTDVSAFWPLLFSFRSAFTAPTFITFTHVVCAILLNTGRQTVCGALRFLPCLDLKHHTCYNRFFSQNKWSLFDIYRVVMGLVLSLIPASETVMLAVDENITRRKGRKVYGKGTYRDPIRSLPKHVAYCWGLRWLVITVQIKLPNIRRRWGLPVFLVLLLPKNGRKDESPKPVDATIEALEQILEWFSQRRFILIGDGAFAAHRLAKFVKKHKQLTLVGRFHKDAALYGPKPPKTGKRGAPRKKGDRLLSPKQEAARKDAAWIEATIPWYKGETKKASLLTGTGWWYQSGKDIVEIRWVWVRLANGHEECFFTTDTALIPVQVTGCYLDRWPIEVTFEEVRRHMHVETTENWSKLAVQRQVPIIYLIFTLIVIEFARNINEEAIPIEQTPWYSKSEYTFTDVIAHVRQKIFKKLIYRDPMPKLWGCKKTIAIFDILIKLSSRAA